MKVLNPINDIYRVIISRLYFNSEKVITRNAATLSILNYPIIEFTKTPLVTTRKVAAKKAIREFEWFMSGEKQCPEEFIDTWWKDQLDPNNDYIHGYSEQYRHYHKNEASNGFDQIAFLLKEIKEHPYSRRNISITWEPYEMSVITTANQNVKTPTPCHGTLSQFFIRDNKLHLKTYQRSADILLGVPHNWIQYWAFLLYLAHHTQFEVGSLLWIFGDLHLYDEESHLKTALEILSLGSCETPENPLLYNYSGGIKNGLPIFKAEDFSFAHQVQEPLVTTRPKLLV